MSYTYTQLQATVKHALGATPTTNITPGEIVNNAIKFLAGLNSWSWRRRLITLNATADQNYIALPANFNQLISLVGFLGLRVVPASIEEIQTYRYQSTTNSAGVLYYAISTASQTNASALPTRRLEIWPTPSATTTTGFLALEYDAEIPALVNGTDVPDIPDQFSPLIRQVCRAMAVSDEEQQQGTDWELFKDMVPTYTDRDSVVQPNLGQPRGGLYDRRTPTTQINFTIQQP